jgi:hypothetical protein
MNLPFQTIASYEKPQVLLTQALDNEFTLRGALQTLVDSDSISPVERDSFTERLKEQVGRNPVTDAVVDIATNPFVLLMAVTSPVGAQMLSRSGKAIFDLGAKFSPLVKEQGGLHAALGLLAPQQLFRGTAITPAVQAFTKGVSELEEEMMATVASPLRRVLEREGLETLNFERITDATKKARALELSRALEASLRGFDREVADKVLRRRKVLDGQPYRGSTRSRAFKERGRFEFYLDDRVTKRLVSSDMDQVVERLGLTELRNAYRTAEKQRKMRMFGDAAESARQGRFVADENKLLRALEGAQFGFQKDGAFKGTAEGIMSMLVDPQSAKLIASGKIDPAQVKGMLKGMIEAFPEHYMPRNVWDMKGAGTITDVMEQRRSRGLVATKSVVSRKSVNGVWDPDDLEDVLRRFGGTEDGYTLLNGTRNRIRAILDQGGVARTNRMNQQEAWSRYFRDTGVTHALYVQTVEELPKLKQAIADTRALVKPEKAADLARGMVRSPFMSDKTSLARFFQSEHYLLEDRYAKEALEVVLRQSAGLEKIEHAATHMALIKGKQGIRTLLDSGIGQAMRGAGTWGQGLYKRLDDVANAELTFGEAKGMSGELARYFYVTHLGINLASVTMNMMQPLLVAANYGGLPNVLKAYTSAFKELGGYISERVGKYGFKALTDEDHAALIKKHFKYADVDGENLIQIGRDTFSTLDTISYKNDLLTGVGRKESYFYDYPMKLFEKAEWLNRSVAAHTVENLYKSKGINIGAGTPGFYRMLRDVDDFVGSTQFGGNTLNTPMAFQGQGPFGRVGNNPLFRQFLSFPTRSVTSLSYEAARMGERGFFKGVGQDFIRGMGISAIFYEVGKNTFGIDLSPGLYGASLTQAFGGDRFFQAGNEYVPIPPVIDIPVNIVRGALDPGQRELLQNNIPRLIPGGVALSRAMGLAPDMPNSPLFGLPGALQKTYVDFKQRTPEGYVAVFKGDGTLIDYQSPGMIFAKQLGVDMGQFKETADFDGFLIKNRDQILEYRRKAISALLANEIGKMQSIRAEFKKRYGMDLTISKDQLDQAIQNRTVSRTERILDRMPPDQRGQFQQMAAGRAPQLGLEAEAITGADTARQRAQARKLEVPPLSPEQQQVMAQMAAQADAGKQGGFEAFKGF